MKRIWKRILGVSAALLGLLILVAILFPMFVKPGPRKNARVLAAPRTLLRNAEITVRMGDSWRKVTTDGSGRFMLRPEEIGKATVDGYVLTRIETNTGIPRLSTYGSKGQFTLAAVDRDGHPLKDVRFYVDRFPSQMERDTYLAKNGRVVLADVPICVDYGIYAAPKGLTDQDFIGMHKRYSSGKAYWEFVYNVDKNPAALPPPTVVRSRI